MMKWDPTTILPHSRSVEVRRGAQTQFITDPPKNVTMNENSPIQNTSRREFIKTTGKFAAASALAGVALPHVHAAGTTRFKSRSSVAADAAPAPPTTRSRPKAGPIKLVAMADVFENRLNSSYNGFKNQHGARVDVPQDRKFIGFDAYKKAMDCLKPGDSPFSPRRRPSAGCISPTRSKRA